MINNYRARHYGWPNTYVFTKAMGEMLLGEMNLNKQLPLVIVRPTIITSTYEEPFPGWVEGIRYNALLNFTTFKNPKNIGSIIILWGRLDTLIN